MTTGTGRVTAQPAWKALEAHHWDIHAVHLRELFACDPRRGQRLTAEAAGIYLDYSKNRIVDERGVFTQGVVWNLDSFDQWGVELGRVLAQTIVPELGGGAEPALGHDSSTNELIRRHRRASGVTSREQDSDGRHTL